MFRVSALFGSSADFVTIHNWVHNSAFVASNWPYVGFPGSPQGSSSNLLGP